MKLLESLNISANTNLIIPELRVSSYTDDAQLQRTHDWHIDRIGRVTGSLCKNLMSCTKLSSKMPWDAPEKVYDFGIGFRRTVYKMYVAKKFNQPFIGKDAQNFKYGRIIEPLIISKLPDQIIHKECGSIDIIDGVLSASPDGDLMHKETKNRSSFEAKAAMDSDNVFSRIEENYDQNHIDFWQTQTEMMALDTKTLVYAVAFPAFDINKVFKLREDDDNIEELNELIPAVEFKLIEASKTHQSAIYERAEVAGKCRDYKLNNEHLSIDECIYKVLSEEI